MKEEKIFITSFNMSRKLKKLKIEQKSAFYWWQGGIVGSLQLAIMSYGLPNNDRYYSAFTIDEIISLFPSNRYSCKLICEENGEFVCVIEEPMFACDNSNGCQPEQLPKQFYKFRDKNPANSCAKMLIHIVESFGIDLIKKENK